MLVLSKSKLDIGPSVNAIGTQYRKIVGARAHGEGTLFQPEFAPFLLKLASVVLLSPLSSRTRAILSYTCPSFCAPPQFPGEAGFVQHTRVSAQGGCGGCAAPEHVNCGTVVQSRRCRDVRGHPSENGSHQRKANLLPSCASMAHKAFGKPELTNKTGAPWAFEWKQKFRKSEG